MAKGGFAPFSAFCRLTWKHDQLPSLACHPNAACFGVSVVLGFTGRAVLNRSPPGRITLSFYCGFGSPDRGGRLGWPAQTAGSTDGDQRNSLIHLVAADAGCVRVKHRHAIHQKSVLMMAGTELYLNPPPAVHGLLHGQWVPAVEITRQFDQLGAGGSAIKIDRLVAAVGVGSCLFTRAFLFCHTHKWVVRLMLNSFLTNNLTGFTASDAGPVPAGTIAFLPFDGR